MGKRRVSRRSLGNCSVNSARLVGDCFSKWPHPVELPSSSERFRSSSASYQFSILLRVHNLGVISLMLIGVSAQLHPYGLPSDTELVFNLELGESALKISIRDFP